MAAKKKLSILFIVFHDGMQAQILETFPCDKWGETRIELASARPRGALTCKKILKTSEMMMWRMLVFTSDGRSEGQGGQFSEGHLTQKGHLIERGTFVD